MKHAILSVPCTDCEAPVDVPCEHVDVVDDSFFDDEKRQHDLYYYAVSCALSALIGYAASHGRGWFHFADGELIAGSEILLS
jgi:hypothetical protein